MSTINPRKLIIVDDDRDFVQLLKRFFSHEGYELISAFDAADALKIIEEQSPALMILDVILPSMNGLDLLRQVHGAGMDIPIIILSGRSEETDRILGLDLGADDYLPKPCNPRELLARVRSIMRRTGFIKSIQPLVVNFGNLTVDRSRHTIACGEACLTITGAEFRIIDALVRANSSIVGRERLTELALGRKLRAFDRAVDTHISNLRRKLIELNCSDLEIRGVRGVGYLLVHSETEHSMKLKA
jgi:two-component system response regulator CpxR